MFDAGWQDCRAHCAVCDRSTHHRRTNSLALWTCQECAPPRRSGAPDDERQAMKTCSVCGESKPESEYYRQKIRGKGYEYSFCIPCKNAKAKDYAKRTGRATASFTPGEVALMALVLNEMAGEAVGQTSSFSSVREKFTRMLSKAQKEGNEE